MAALRAPKERASPARLSRTQDVEVPIDTSLRGLVVGAFDEGYEYLQ